METGSRKMEESSGTSIPGGVEQTYDIPRVHRGQALGK